MRRIFVGLLFVVVCLIPRELMAQFSADILQTMDNVSPQPLGASLTGTVLGNGVIGTLGSWSKTGSGTTTVGAHQPGCALSRPAVIGGTTYAPSTPTQSLAFDNGTNFTDWSVSIPSGHSRMSLGVCITFGSVPGATNLMDMVRIDGTSGGYVVMQLRSSPTGCLNIETNGPNHSGCIIVSNGATYWCTMLVDAISGTAQLACFQPTAPFAQIGATVTAPQGTGSLYGTISVAHVGNTEVGTASGTTNYFENLVFDYTHAAFPLGQGLLWAGIIAPGRAIDWSQAGASGGIRPRTTICFTFSPGATSSQINSAISSCPPGQAVFLNAGTYSGLSTILFSSKSNVTLRGAGADQTILQFSGTSGCQGGAALICIQSTDVNWKGSPSNTANWTAGYAQGTSTITLSSTPNLHVGNPIILDQLDDTENGGCDTGAIIVTQSNSSCSPTGPGVGGPFSLQGNNGGSQRTSGGFREQEQQVTVTSCNGNSTPGISCTGTNVSVGISPALYMANWRSSQSPQAWWASNPVTGDGVEDISIDGTNAPGAIGVEFFNASNSWVTRIRSINTSRAHVQFQYANRITVKDNYFFLVQVSQPSHYGIDCYGGSDFLVENNIFQGIVGPMMWNSACVGGVAAYNFMTNMYYQSSPGWNEGASTVHTAGDTFDLLEGNIAPLVDADVFHGTHHFITNFRNYQSGYQPECYSSGSTYATSTYSPCSGDLYASRIEAFSRFFNYVGNVLGTSGIHTSYVGGSPSIFATVGLGNSDGTVTVPSDPNTSATLLRWGNYDVVTGAVRWCGNSSDTGWASSCGGTSEVPASLSGAQAPFLNAVPTLGDTAIGEGPMPQSFYNLGKPSWWPVGKPWPAIGPDVTGGTIPNLGGHAYTNPAQDCFLSLMGGPSDGTGPVLNFSATACYGGASVTLPAPPTGVRATVQ